MEIATIYSRFADRALSLSENTRWYIHEIVARVTSIWQDAVLSTQKIRKDLDALMLVMANKNVN